MKLVQPIRSQELIDRLSEELQEMNEKYFIMFTIGITSGLRISDILNIKVKDIKRNYIQIIEKKTDKPRVFKLNEFTKELCLNFIEDNNLKDDDYVIYSNKKDSEGKDVRISGQ